MKKILVVDNNKVILRLLQDYLEGQGYEVKTAEDGLVALDILVNYAAEVVFVDLIMPKINGEKLCRILRNTPTFREMDLVVISAIATEEQLDFVSFGADACLAKGPFQSMRHHIDTILRLLEEKQYSQLGQKIYGADEIYEREVTRELLAAKKHYELTLDHIADGFLELTSTGLITFANRAAAKLFGRDELQMLAVYFPSLFEEQYRDQIEEGLHSLDQHVVVLGEQSNIRSGERDLLVKFIPYHDKQKWLYIVLLHDISQSKTVQRQLSDQLKKMEQERQELLSQLDESQAEIRRLQGQSKGK